MADFGLASLYRHISQLLKINLSISSYPIGSVSLGNPEQRTVGCQM